MRPITSRSALPTQISTLARLGQRLLDRLLDQVVDLDHLAAAAACSAGPSRPARRTRGSASPGPRSPCDTTSVATRWSPRASTIGPRPATPRRPAATASRSRSTTSASRPALDLASTCWAAVQHLGVVGRDRHRQAAAQALAQVGVQVGLELAGQVLGRRDRQVLERVLAPHVEGHLGGVAQVLLGVRLQRAGGGRRPGRARRGRRSSRGSASNSSDRSTSSPSSNTNMRARWRSASSTPIGSCSRSTDSSWPTAGTWLTTTLAVHRHGQLDDLATAGRPSRRRWPGRGSGTGRGRRGRSCSMRWRSGCDRRLAVGLARRADLEQDVDLVLEVLVAGQPAAVDVEVARRDRRLARP